MPCCGRLRWVDDDGAFLDEVTGVVGVVRRCGVRGRFDSMVLVLCASQFLGEEILI